MDGIAIVLFAVACSGDLLSCVQIPTGQHAFADPAECQIQREIIISEYGGVDLRYPNVMGRCRYIIHSKGLDTIGLRPAGSKRAKPREERHVLDRTAPGVGNPASARQ